MDRSYRSEKEFIAELRESANPLGEVLDIDPLLDQAQTASHVLLGEATHGTREFYRWRAETSKRLIVERQFRFIAVEGDWPDCWEINRYIKGYSPPDLTARAVLMRFKRWPTWMWANEEMVEFIEWLKDYNESFPEELPVGFYGLDVYSLWESLYAVMRCRLWHV
ncbi:MAG: erythromycin esterase family protein [Patescibacteria group bacterium]